MVDYDPNIFYGLCYTIFIWSTVTSTITCNSTGNAKIAMIEYTMTINILR